MKTAKWVAERDAAFTKLVLKDDISGVLAYARKYKVSVPTNERALKGGVYKAVQECRSIPDEVKAIARAKCIALGMKPTMWG